MQPVLQAMVVIVVLYALTAKVAPTLVQWAEDATRWVLAVAVDLLWTRPRRCLGLVLTVWLHLVLITAGLTWLTVSSWSITVGVGQLLRLWATVLLTWLLLRLWAYWWFGPTPLPRRR